MTDTSASAPGQPTAQTAGLASGGAGYYLTGRKPNLYYAGDHATSVTIPLDTWTHIAAVVRNGNLTHYINGVADPNTYTGVPTATYGRSGTNSGGADQYAGAIDDLRFYNRALAAEDIYALANPSPVTVGRATVRSGVESAVRNAIQSATY